MRSSRLLLVPLFLAGCGSSAPEQSTDGGVGSDAARPDVANGDAPASQLDSSRRAADSSAPETGGPDTGRDSGSVMTTDAGPSSSIPADFFNASWNHTPPGTWCPTDSRKTTATVHGARLWDDGFKWAQLESADGVYTSAFTSTMSKFLGPSYAQDTTCPVDVLYTFGATPAWAALPGSDPKCSGPTTSGGKDTAGCIPPKDLDSNAADCNANKSPGTSCGNGADALFQSFVYKVVSTYKGQIKYYECWNEPDGAGNFWSNDTSFGGTGHAPTAKDQPPLIRLVRMCYDVMQIVHQVDPAAKVLSPSFHGPTALTWMHYFATTSVDQPGCSGACSAALGGATWSASTVTGAQTFDITNAHLRGTDNAEPEAFLTAYQSAAMEIKNDGLPATFFDDEWGPVNQSSPPDAANLDILASYVSRSLALRASVYPGLSRVWFYQWDSPDGTGVSSLEGNIAGTAWDVTASWLTGSTMKACTSSGTVWQCPGTTGKGVSFIIAWDTSQSCASGCTTTNSTFPGYAHYTDLLGDEHAASGGVVPLGLKPVLVTP